MRAKKKTCGKGGKRKSLYVIGGLVIFMMVMIVFWASCMDWLIQQHVIVQGIFLQITVVISLAIIFIIVAKDIKNALKGVLTFLPAIWALDILTPDYALSFNFSRFGTFNTSTAATFQGWMDYQFAYMWHGIGVPEGIFLVILTYPVMVMILLGIAYLLVGPGKFLNEMSRGEFT